MAAKVFKEQNPKINVKVWTTIVPKRWHILVLKKIGFINIANRLEDRLEDLKVVDEVISEPISEIFCLVMKKFLPSELALGMSFKLFSSLISKRILKKTSSGDIVIFRSGSGSKINQLKNKGVRVITDHSIAHPKYFHKIRPYLSNPQNEFNPESILWTKVLQDCLKSDEILTISEYVKKSFPCEFRKKNFYVVPLPIDISNVANVEKDFLNHDIIFVGHFSRRKGSDVFLKIAEEFLPFTEFRFKIIGEIHDDGEWIKRLANVQTLGLLPYDGVIHQMQQSRALLFPTRLEGGAKVIQEAWQLGLPVITTQDCACPISEKNSIEITLPFDIKLCNELMLKLKNDDELRQLSEAGKHIARELYSPSVYGRNLYSVINSN